MNAADWRKDKRCVAANFNRAAARYDGSAEFQRLVAERLLEHLDYMTLAPRRALDLGAGTGRAARALARRYRAARIVEADLAPDMLRHGRDRLRWFSRRRPVCADAERLPFADASFDLVFSSLMLQWCDDLRAVLAETRRVLAPGGLFLFATLGPDTLGELRASWAAADPAAAPGTHVNAFVDMHDLGDALLRAGLADPVLECDRFTLTYADAHALMRDLKSLGARNANAARRRALTGRRRMQAMLDAYERHRQAGRLPATYEVVYGHAWRGAGAAQPDAGVVTVPISAIGRFHGHA